MKNINKKGNILTWIVVIIVILGLIFVAYKIMSKSTSKEPYKNNSVITENSNNTLQQNNSPVSNVDSEKPPRPPE